MRTQTLKPTRREAIVIATPMGLIRLIREKGSQFRLELPDGCRAYKSDERAIATSPYLERDNGVIRPAYRMLVPVIDSTGAVIDVEAPRGPLRVQPRKE